MFIKRKKKVRTQEEIEEINRMWFFFSLIWAELKEKKCGECDIYLGQEMKSYMFDHLLEKNKYPEFKYEKDNIFVVCGHCHTNKTNGFPGPKHKQAIEDAKKRFLIT